MRKIDADVLIKTLEFYVNHSMEGSEAYYAYMTALEEVEQQSTIDDWTPVEEGLPTNDDDVLVSTVNDDIKIAWYDHMWDSEKGSYDDEEIMAWQPSPKPYKKKGE